MGSTAKGRKIFRQREQRKALNMNPADRMGVAQSLEILYHNLSQRVFIQYKSH
jgi:hypothetical protein